MVKMDVDKIKRIKTTKEKGKKEKLNRMSIKSFLCTEMSRKCRCSLKEKK